MPYCHHCFYQHIIEQLYLESYSICFRELYMLVIDKLTNPVFQYGGHWPAIMTDDVY